MKETIKVTINNIHESKIKHFDWWIWVASGIVITLGALLTVFSAKALYDSYSGTPLVGYIAGISGGITIFFAGITQLMVLLHRRRDEKENKYSKVEHDFTNFFIKNSVWNEIVLYTLKHAKQAMKITGDIKVSEINKKEKKTQIEISIEHTYANLNLLIDSYIIYIGDYLLRNTIFRNLLVDKYKISFNKPFKLNDYTIAASAFDTEVKKTLLTLEKIMQSYYQNHYDGDVFNSNLGKKLKQWTDVLIPYMVLILQSSTGKVGVNNIDMVPYVLYDLSKKGK